MLPLFFSSFSLLLFNLLLFLFSSLLSSSLFFSFRLWKGVGVSLFGVSEGAIQFMAYEQVCCENENEKVEGRGKERGKKEKGEQKRGKGGERREERRGI